MRGSPEPGADLISRGAAVRDAHLAAVCRSTPAPLPGLALPSRNAGSASCIWSAFLGAAGAPSGAWPGAGVGAAPPGFPGSSLLWQPVWLPGRLPGRPPGRKGQRDVAFSPRWGDFGTSCLAPIVERAKLRPGQAPCPGPRSSPVVWAVVGQMLISVLKWYRSESDRAHRGSLSRPFWLGLHLWLAGLEALGFGAWPGAQ